MKNTLPSYKTKVVFAILLFSFLAGCSVKNDDVLNGNFWKQQAIEDIIPYWTENARDTVDGAFITNLDSTWNQFGSTNKYPCMISRHIYSYSVAYLLTGEKKYIDMASETVEFLIKYAWDKKYGGWYHLLDKKGNPIDKSKKSFTQFYANTGLIMYYFVTHDKKVLEYVERSNELIESRRWDKKYGGYFASLNRNLSVDSYGKPFSSEVVPVSSYLMYLYLATRDAKYLEQAERIMDVVLSKMRDTESGWIQENFSREWNYSVRKENLEKEINIGHNVETVWMLYRLYLLTGNENYINLSEPIIDKMFKWGFEKQTGLWYTTTGRVDPSIHGETTYWWVQAYNNMFNLIQYRVTDDDQYLRYFEKGSEFWNDNFIDRENGDNHFEVNADGTAKEKKKAGPYKTSYHSIESAFLNYLYLEFWVNDKPVELNYYINSSDKGEKLFPCPIEDDAIQIEKVIINNENYTGFNEQEAYVVLPELKNGLIKITLAKK